MLPDRVSQKRDRQTKELGQKLLNQEIKILKTYANETCLKRNAVLNFKNFIISMVKKYHASVLAKVKVCLKRIFLLSLEILS